MQSATDNLMGYDVTIFTKPGCARCVNLKQLISNKYGIDVHELDVSDSNLRLTDAEYKTPYEYAKYLGATSLPILLIRTSFIDQHTGKTTLGYAYAENPSPDKLNHMMQASA